MGTLLLSSTLNAIIYVYFMTGAIAYRTVIPDPDGDPYKPMPPPVISAEEKDKQYWHNLAHDILDEKLNQRLNKNVAKNVIFFIGDGMSIPTIAAARIYEGQMKNISGEEHKLFFESFPFTGLSKTYCTDKQVADSAATATAYLSGVKSNCLTIGVTAKVQLLDCEGAKNSDNQVSSIVQWAQDAGKATGIVTTARVTHASPAGAYSHIAFRDLESDHDVREKDLDPNSCNEDIAEQLIYNKPGKNLNVIMGGGRMKFLPNNMKDPVVEKFGQREDGFNLIEEWKMDKLNRSKIRSATGYTRDDLLKLDTNHTDYFLGLFAYSHLDYHLESNGLDQPSLAEMTKSAIEILQHQGNGYYLFVEGGRIDMAHHDNLAHLALDETVELSKAIQMAAEMTSEDDTLIVVTADHSHVMTFAGYPARGTDILKYYGKDMNNFTYPTLSYANGPGYHKEIESGVHHNYTHDDININYVYPAMVEKRYESHGGDDVAVYARGPWAHLFTGNYEQHYIAIAKAYAANIGYKKNSDSLEGNNGQKCYSINLFIISSVVLLLIMNN